MKKRMIFLRLFAFALSWMVFTSAAQQTQKACVFDGFYTNLSIGGALRSGKGIWTNNAITDFDSVPLQTYFRNSLSFNLRQRSPLVALSLGQGYSSYGHFYGGWEAYISHSKYKRHSPIVGHGLLAFSELNAALTNTLETSLNSTEVGFDLKPGFVFNCNALLYGRLGLAYNKLTLQSSPGFTMNMLPPGGPFAASVMTTVENSKKRASFRLGLGLEKHLGNCLSLRMDYAFTYYGKISAVVMDSHSIIESGSTTLATITDTTRIKLIGNTITLGLSYWW